MPYRKKILYLSFVLALIMSTGCLTLYKPNVIHSPLLKAKGELNTAASIGVSGSGLYNLQIAYALTDHLGLMADGMYHRRVTHNSDSSAEKLNIFSGEAGIGYYSRLGSERRGLFQCYAGAGSGGSSDRIHTTYHPQPDVSARYYNLFFQPGVGYCNENFEFALDTRLNYVNMTHFNGYLYDKFEWWNTDYQYFSGKKMTFALLEPAITLKTGNRTIKGVLQTGVTFPIYHPDTYFAVNPSSLLLFPLIKFSVGLQYTFGNIY